MALNESAGAIGSSPACLYSGCMRSPTLYSTGSTHGGVAKVPLRARIAELMTRVSGSMTFVVVHAVWFTCWIVYNLSASSPFDPFPFGLLTLIVSLEAIFLSTFVLISQNRDAARSEERAQQDFRTNVYSESMSELVAERLGITSDQVEERYRQRLSEAKRQDDADPKT